MRVWLAFLLLLPFVAGAQHRMRFISKDSLPTNPVKNWAFHECDSAIWASPTYDDSNWPRVHSDLRYDSRSPKPGGHFNSIGWLRYHFIADSSITGKPLAFRITHFGASVIYLDGKVINDFGVIKGPGTICFDPQLIPITFVIDTPGEHMIAVRYANYNAERNNNVYGRNFAGFKLTISNADDAIWLDHGNAISITTLMLFLFGIFLALSFLHLVMYLFHRQVKANLYFSIFCFSISLSFLLVFANRFFHNPSVQLYAVFTTVIIIASACLSLSGFSNHLFARRKVRFHVITVLCLITPLLIFIDFWWLAYSFMVLICGVTLETIILISRAIYRRVPGARILASGVLFMALFFFCVTFFLIVNNSIEFDDSNPGAQVILLIGMLSILSLPVSISVYLAWSYAHTSKNLAVQLQQVQTLSEKTLQQEQEKQRLLESRKEELETEVAARTADLVAEKKKSDDLLMNILPEEVAEELKQSGSSSARFFDNVTVLFSDFVNFTTASERMSPQELVNELHACFKAFDEIISRYNIEKIKTIGDAYLAVSGLPAAQQEHAQNVAKAALEMRDYMVARKAQLGDKTFDIRIGLHSGSVVAGIVGVKKFAYDIWGDTVNTAARMEQNSEPGRINVSQATYELIKDQFTCIYRGEIHAKNKGELSMYFVEALTTKGATAM